MTGNDAVIVGSVVLAHIRGVINNIGCEMWMRIIPVKVGLLLTMQ